MMNATNHLKAIAQRLVNADTHFIAMLSELHGFSEADATKIFETYRKLKCIKLDSYMGRWNVKHGGFLDRDVCERALAYVAPSRKKG
jgi:hypothetical protein